MSLGSISSIVKGLDLGEVDVLLDSARFGNVEGLAVVFGLEKANRNIRDIERALEKRKADLTQGFGTGGAPPTVTGASGGVRLPPDFRSIQQRGGAIEIVTEVPSEAGEETKEPDPRTGLRQRRGHGDNVGHGGVDDDDSQRRIQEGIRDALRDPNLRDVELGEMPTSGDALGDALPVSEEGVPRTRMRIPRPSRRMVGVAGALGTSIALIPKLWPGSVVVKKYTDGTVDVVDKEGKTHRIDPRMFASGMSGRSSMGAPMGEDFLMTKYRTPRHGRWDSRLFTKYARASAINTNPSSMNETIGRNLTAFHPSIRTTGRRVQIDQPKRAGGLI
jgi:hypothetical protein